MGENVDGIFNDVPEDTDTGGGKMLEPQVNEKTYNLKDIATFLKDKEIKIPAQYSLDEYFTRTLHEIYYEEDDEGIKRRTSRKVNIDLPIGIDRETLQSFLGEGKYNFFVKDISQKFVTSKMLDFGEHKNETQQKEVSNMPYEPTNPSLSNSSNNNDYFTDEIDRLRDELKSVRKDKEEKFTEMMKLQNETEKLKSRLDLLKQNYESEKMRLQDEIARIKREKDNAIEKSKDLSEELKSKKEELDKKHTIVEELKEERTDIKYQNNTLEMKIDNLKEELEKIRNENASLKTENTSLRNSQQRPSGDRTFDKIIELLLTDKQVNREANATVETERIRSKTDLEKSKMDMLTQVLLSQAEAGGNYSELPPEKKGAFEDILGKFLPNFIEPIKNVLEKTGLTLVNQDELKKMLDEREQIGAAKVASAVKQRIKGSTAKKQLPNKQKTKEKEVPNEKK